MSPTNDDEGNPRDRGIDRGSGARAPAQSSEPRRLNMSHVLRSVVLAMFAIVFLYIAKARRHPTFELCPLAAMPPTTDAARSREA